MDIDQKTASALGFPKPEYRSVERERRWLSRDVARERIAQTETVTDLYATGTRLRLGSRMIRASLAATSP